MKFEHCCFCYRLKIAYFCRLEAIFTKCVPKIHPAIPELEKHIQEAKKLKLIRIETDEDKLYVVYLHNQMRLRLTDEERVRVWAYKDLVVRMGYPFAQVKFEHKIKVGSGYKRADILVTDSQSRPYIVLECKKPQTDSVKMEEAYKQLKSYADLERASYIWLSNYTENTVQELFYHGKYTRHKDLFALPPFAYASQFKFKLWILFRLFFSLFKKLSSLSLSFSFLRNILILLTLAGLAWVAVNISDYQNISEIALQVAWYALFVLWIVALLFVLFKIAQRKKPPAKKAATHRKRRVTKAKAVRKIVSAKKTLVKKK